MRAFAALAGSLLGGCGAVAIDVVAPAEIAGDQATPFTLPSTTGTGTGQLALADVLSHGPAVLVFYRGYW